MHHTDHCRGLTAVLLLLLLSVARVAAQEGDTLRSQTLQEVTVAARRRGTVPLGGVQAGMRIGQKELFRELEKRPQAFSFRKFPVACDGQFLSILFMGKFSNSLILDRQRLYFLYGGGKVQLHTSVSSFRLIFA